MIPSTAQVGQIAILGEVTAEQQDCLEACAGAVGGKVLAVGSFEGLRKLVSRHPDRPATLIIVLKENLKAVIAMLMRIRKTGLRIPLVAVVDSARGMPCVPLMRELGVHHIVRTPMRVAEFTDALHAALAEDSLPPPPQAPPLTGEELGGNIERLANDLNRRIGCGAGQNQVFLHSYVEGIGRKTPPRITLRCPLRVEFGLEPYVHYEHIRDVCCHAADTCTVLRAYVATNGQEISRYLVADGSKEDTMTNHTQAAKESMPVPELSSTASAPSIEQARPRHGLLEKDQFLKAVARLGASDLHLKTGLKPRVRVGGVLRTLDVEIMPNAQFEEKVFAFLAPEQQQRLIEDGSVDLAYDVPGSDRFRINIFRQESGLSVAARRVTRTIPSFEALNLPPIIEKISEYEQGLVLLAGVTGSGKSTTIAAMIEHINQTRADHIVTIEDPIEYLFTSKKSLVNQREIGINVKDFPTALRSLVREDPDDVLIGEMRDSETFRAAMQAAETGHLVFGTVHASSCAQTIGRVLDLFPEDERHAVRQSFVFNLRAIVAQKLLPSIREGVSRVPASEVLLNVPIVQKLIAEERDSEIVDAIRGGEEGMRSFTDSLEWLIENEFIDHDTALAAAPNPEELKMRLRGIRQGTGHILG